MMVGSEGDNRVGTAERRSHSGKVGGGQSTLPESLWTLAQDEGSPEQPLGSCFSCGPGVVSPSICREILIGAS